MGQSAVLSGHTEEGGDGGGTGTGTMGALDCQRNHWERFTLPNFTFKNPNMTSCCDHKWLF